VVLSPLGLALASPRIRALLRSDWIYLIILLGSSLLLGHAASYRTYYGNEYEDSYEYVESARFLAHVEFDWDLAYNPTCLLGATSDCIIAGNTSHPVGFSALVAMLSGDPRSVERVAVWGSWLGSILTPIALFLAVRLSGEVRPAAFFAGVFFGALPIRNLYATTPTPEALSILVSTVAVAAWIAIHSDPGHPKRSQLRLYALFVLLIAGAVFLRRDHLVLLGALPIATLASALVRYRSFFSRVRRHLVVDLAVLGVCTFGLAMVLDPTQAGMRSIGDYAGRFDDSRFLKYMTAYVVAFASVEWYMGIPLFAVACLIRFRARPLVLVSPEFARRMRLPGEA